MRFAIFPFLVATAAPVCAADFSAELINPPAGVLRGTEHRLTAVIRNASGKPIKVCSGEHGFSYEIRIHREDGKQRITHWRDTAPSVTSYSGTRTLPDSWSEQAFIEEMPVIDQPGIWLVNVIVSSRPPFVDRMGHPLKDDKGIWVGEVSSQEYKIKIVAPQGIDKEAYEAFKGAPVWPAYAHELLRRFPFSTYAGYAFKTVGGFVSVAPARFEESFADLTSPNFFKTHPIVNPENKTEVLTDPEGAVRGRIKALEAFLVVHPDFEARADLYWQLAPLYLVTGRYQDAYDTYRKYETEGGCEECRGFARQVNSKLAQQGMVKPQ